MSDKKERVTPRKERFRWICDWIEKNGYADILNADFVWDYSNATNARIGIHAFGAPACPMLDRDLGAMHKAGYLDRTTIGIGQGLCSMGFPKWVYSYRISRGMSDDD